MENLFTDQLQTNKSEFLELTEEVLTTNLLMVGETHGVKENAYLYYSFFKLFELNTLAIAYPQKLKEPILNFIQTGAFPFQQITESLSDGNFNKTYVMMMKHLYTEGLLKNLIFIEPSETNFPHWNDREKAYLETFTTQNTPQNKTLLVVGNLHTETDPFTIESDNPGESGTLFPLAFHLREHRGDFPICRLFYHSGKYFNLGHREFPQTNMPKHMLRKRSSKSMEYEIHLDNVTPVDSF